MNHLGTIVQAVQRFDEQASREVSRARSEPAFGAGIVERFDALRAKAGTSTTPTGLQLPRVAMPMTDDPGEMARYLIAEGAPGEFPYVNAAYPQMYLEPVDDSPIAEEPTRLFAGLGLAEDTNQRFHFLTKHQRSNRLSTAFDGPTLYGLDSDAEGVLGKVGEGGVAIDTIEDMERLYAGFDLRRPDFSASMTINGPAPILLAMYVAAAIRRFGKKVMPNLRGTVQADILKEVQAQNEAIFPTEASLRFLTDTVEFTSKAMPRWYPISISGYHIAEAGATPVQQAAYTISNGFAYVEMFQSRGMDVNQFGPRLSFFLDCGLDVEYLALARVCRKIWAVGMRDVFHADRRAQILKLHTQTSGRSLIAQEFQNNLTRTAVELMLAYMNNTNSCHSNSADEPFTTPGEEYVRLAAHSQGVLLEETGLFKHTMNLLSGSPGMRAVEAAVQKAVLAEFAEIDRLGGVLAAMTHRYQRSQIQNSAHRYETQVYAGKRPIIALNRYADPDQRQPEIRVVRTGRTRQRTQISRLQKFKTRHKKASAKALNELASVVVNGGNVFAQLLATVQTCSLGQITGRLQEIVGKFRPSV